MDVHPLTAARCHVGGMMSHSRPAGTRDTLGAGALPSPCTMLAERTGRVGHKKPHLLAKAESPETGMPDLLIREGVPVQALEAGLLTDGSSYLPTPSQRYPHQWHIPLAFVPAHSGASVRDSHPLPVSSTSRAITCKHPRQYPTWLCPGRAVDRARDAQAVEHTFRKRLDASHVASPHQALPRVSLRTLVMVPVPAETSLRARARGWPATTP
jgi:hypothetical protein